MVCVSLECLFLNSAVRVLEDPLVNSRVCFHLRWEMRCAAAPDVSASESANARLHFLFLVRVRDDAEELEGGEFTGVSVRQLHVPVDFVDDNLDLLISDEYIEAVFTVRH